MGIVVKLPVKVVRPVEPSHSRDSSGRLVDDDPDSVPMLDGPSADPMYLYVIAGGRPPDDDETAPEVGAPQPPTA
ncbi:hypothetical protein BMS3Abin12_00004 [bacterium BMS3Abin12]|nr:hypothetical protein BMS3Abin12_00004 [bacterium BMS3Abin12]